VGEQESNVQRLVLYAEHTVVSGDDLFISSWRTIRKPDAHAVIGLPFRPHTVIQTALRLPFPTVLRPMAGRCWASMR
jgi:hypothetical protein